MITLTDAASTKIRDIAETDGLQCCLRVKVIGGGCAGFTYDMFFDTGKDDTDEQFVSKGITLICDQISIQYLEGTEIDYIESLQQSGFKFTNPSSKGSCGCGSSFSV